MSVFQILPTNKPKFGEACNRCGLCCMLQLCEAALLIFGTENDEGPCPALEWDSEQTACGLIRSPAKHTKLNWGTAAEREVINDRFIGPLIEKSLGIGAGCGMDDEYPVLGIKGEA